MYKPAVHIILK